MKLTPEERAAEITLLRDLYLDKRWSLADIAEAVGISTEAIRLRCHAYGIPLRPPLHRKSIVDKLRAALETVK